MTTWRYWSLLALMFVAAIVVNNGALVLYSRWAFEDDMQRVTEAINRRPPHPILATKVEQLKLRVRHLDRELSDIKRDTTTFNALILQTQATMKAIDVDTGVWPWRKGMRTLLESVERCACRSVAPSQRITVPAQSTMPIERRN